MAKVRHPGAAPGRASPAARLAAVEAHLARRPADGAAWLAKARLLAAHAPGPELGQALSRALELLPDNYQAWSLAASIRARQLGAEAARDWLREQTGRAPQLAAAMLLAERAPAQAARQLKSLAQAGENDARPRVLLAELQRARGQHAAAARWLESALAIDPRQPGYWQMLADSRLRQAQAEAAIEAADRALAIDTRLPGALDIRGEARRMLGDWSGALDDFRASAALQAPSAPALNRIGNCLVRLERLAEAEEHFRQALALDARYPHARLNLGLLAVTRADETRARACIGEALKSPEVDAATRSAARTALIILSEQQRLRPAIEVALREGEVAELQTTLARAPRRLVQPDPRQLDLLRRLAGACGALTGGFESWIIPGETALLPFIEACGQHKLASEPEALLEVLGHLIGAPSPAWRGPWRPVGACWQAGLDRRTRPASVLLGRAGEAWLRYWHARLLAHAPERLPGQFKAVTNTVGDRRGGAPVAPEGMVGTVRRMLADIAPQVPAGFARGLFWYLSICLLHGFVDGNGRVARFLLAWECESIHGQALVVPAESQAALVAALPRAFVEMDMEPLVEALHQAQRRAAGHLEALSALARERFGCVPAGPG